MVFLSLFRLLDNLSAYWRNKQRRSLQKNVNMPNNGSKLALNSVCNSRTTTNRPMQIMFYNPAKYQRSRNINKHSHFSFNTCKISSCVLHFGRKITSSDAVIFSSWMDQRATKRCGQVWIVLQMESPQMHNYLYRRQAPIWLTNKINWTMTYSKNADIYLPYGRMRKVQKPKRQVRDYFRIASTKTMDAIWIVSHCETYSRREDYVAILKQYISVDILGACGKKWHCGQRNIHDNCFDALNTTYRYYLAFENSICQEYITEKFFENYKYNVIQVVRADKSSKLTIDISSKAYVNTNDFQNAHQLGKYLKNLSANPEMYATMLQHKDNYEVVPYEELFQDAACEICRRLHDRKSYISLYRNVSNWMDKNEPCFEPTDL